MPIYTFPDPETLTLQDNFSVTEILELPPLVHCTWQAKDCADLWHNVKCINDSDYQQPYVTGDKIIIQTRFLDYQNLPDEFRCPPPLKEGKAIMQLRLLDNPLVVYGDANKNYLWNNEFDPPSNCGTVGRPVWAGNFAELQTKNYTNFSEFKEGTLTFWTTYPLTTNPIVTRIADDVLQFEYDIEAFTQRFGVSPCNSVYLDCFRYDDGVNWIQADPNDPYAPKTEQIFPFTCCPEAPPCFGLARDESGCSIPSDFARARFQIVPNVNYVFGAGNQASAGVTDVGFIIIRESEPCPSWNTAIDPLLLFSGATDFANYITRVQTWIETNILLPNDTITANTTTGEFEILFHKVDHQDDGWSVCADRLKLCEVRYNAGVQCVFNSELKEISFIFDGFTVGAGTTTVSIYLTDAPFAYTVNSVPETSLNDLILYVVDDFNTNALGNSYAVPFSGVPNTINAGGFNGIKFYIDTDQYPDACDGVGWQFGYGNPALTLYPRVYETEICCDRGCNENENGYASFDFYMPANFTINVTNPITFALFYDCANLVPSIAYGLSTVIPASANWNDFLLNMVSHLNNSATISAMSLPSGTYFQLFGQNIRMRVPVSGLPAVTCVTNREFNLAINLDDGMNNIDIQVENRHWCQTDCSVAPPEQHQIIIDILDDPSYVFGDPNNHAWIYVLHNQADCEGGLPPPGYPTTADAVDLQDYVEQLQKWLLDYFEDFGGKNSFFVQPNGSDWQIIGNIDRFAYRFGTGGYDPCEGLKLCYDNEVLVTENKCHYQVTFYVNAVNPPAIASTIDVRINFICGINQTGFVVNIPFGPGDNLISVVSNIISQFNTDFPEIIVSTGAFFNQIVFQIPCDHPFFTGLGCGCTGGFLGTNVGIEVYAGGAGGDETNPPVGAPYSNVALNRAFSYEGCVETGGGSGTPFIINATLTNDNSCCTECYNPLDYLNFKVRIDTKTFTTFQVVLNQEGRGCFGGSVLSLLVPIVGYASNEIACQALANHINKRIYGDAFAKADGEILTVWVRSKCACPPETERFIDVFLNGSIIQQLKPDDCCKGAGTPDAQQSVGLIITENNACCDDYFINVTLVDCCCNPITGLTYTPPCDYVGQARAIFDLSGFDLTDIYVSLNGLEDSALCYAVQPFEYIFDGESFFEEQLQDWVNQININGNPDVEASRDGMKLILTWNTILEDCCGAELIWYVGGVQQPPVTVDCCTGTPVPFSIFDAIEGWIVGQNRDPYLEFFQNIQINPDLIPVDCFMIKINDNRGNVHYSECYKKETCLPTVLLCSEYTEGKKDCEGNIYGLPEFGCPAVIEPVYSNCVRVRGEFRAESYEYTTENKKRTTITKYKLITELLPPYMAQKINAVLGGKNITINGIPVEFDGTISRERETGQMWAISAEFTGIECVNDETCE